MKFVLKTFPVLTVWLLAGAARADEKPNILFISIDDLRPTLGCYGDGLVKSPNIDRLSSSAVTFDNCHVQVAVCNPSRASMMTGLRPNTLGCWTLSYHFRETKPDAVTIPQYLRQHGYHAEGHGKIFHNPWQDPRSWSVPHRFGNGSYTNYDKDQLAYVEKVRESLPKDAKLRTFMRGPITNAPVITDDKHSDGDMARTVCERLKALNSRGKPFFLAAGFMLPHLPFCPPKPYWDLYDPAKLRLATNDQPVRGVPDVELGTNYEFSHYADCIDFPTPMGGRVGEEKARRLIHGYLASVAFIDTQVGLILETLEKEGLARNTIVVLWSDHGYKLGEHNGWGKMTNLEIDSRIPFMIRDPRAKANGQRCGRLVESLDIFPTLCELARIPVPAFAEGKSMAALLDQPDAEHTGAAFSQYIYDPLIGNSIRTPEWRYTEWCDMATGEIRHRILYNHRGNHLEDENVFDRHQETADKLQKHLHATLPNQPVRLLPRIHSAKGGESIDVTFVNRYPGGVRLTGISTTGGREEARDIGKDQKHPATTTIGHIFAAESLDGKYHENITIKQGESEIILGSPDAR